METYDYVIRKANISDLERLTEIYNQAISAGYCTCDTEVFTPQERMPWFEEHRNERYPIFVCEIEKEAVGYSYLSPYRCGRNALSKVGEVSYYVDFGYQGYGIGSRLMSYTIESAKRLNYACLLAILLSCNRESIALLKKFGFSEWGVLPEIAVLNNKYHSHLYYGLRI